MKNSPRKIFSIILCVICLLSLSGYSGICVHGDSKTQNLPGKLYILDGKNNYEYTDNSTYVKITDKGELGSFSITGGYTSAGSKNGFDAFEILEGTITFSYEVSSPFIDADEGEWHLVEDSTSKINGERLDAKIKSGAILVMTSLDKEHWSVSQYISDIAGKNTEYKGLVYETNAIQQVNGCYFRIMVVYELEKRVEDTKVAGRTIKKNYEQKKYAEVYEFYMKNHSDVADDVVDSESANVTEMYKDDPVRTTKDGYSGNEPISGKDPHRGWRLGSFYLCGYTSTAANEEGTPVFLRTLGDRITLKFHLDQDITRLNKNEKLSINEDDNAYDQAIGRIIKQNFKRGTLIITYKNEEKDHTPIVYTDFLAACAVEGANTTIELNEEGDYEVVLDYEIKDSSGIGSVSNYRINFSFKIRNGECMVFPFDLVTGDELSNNALTENGFRLDLARSRYLKINVKRTILKKTESIFTEDDRSNSSAGDNKEYTSEGMYTLTVENPTTNKTTTKVIYVGTAPVYKALAKGKTLDEINDLLKQGGELQEDGSITFPTPEPTVEATPEATPEPTAEPSAEPTITEESTVESGEVDSEISQGQSVQAESEAKPTSDVETNEGSEISRSANEGGRRFPIGAVGGGAALVVAVLAFVLGRKSRR